MEATVRFVFTSINFTGCSVVLAAGDAEQVLTSRGFVLVSGAVGGGPGSGCCRVAALLPDRGVPVRASVPTQDHRADQLRHASAANARAQRIRTTAVSGWSPNSCATCSAHPWPPNSRTAAAMAFRT